MGKEVILKKLHEVQELKNTIVKRVWMNVCDTGKTYLKIRELFESLGATEVSLIVLVDKATLPVQNSAEEQGLASSFH